MASINIKVDHAHSTHRFSLLRTSGKPHYPSFSQLCETLVSHLKLDVSPSQLTSHHPPIQIWYLDGDGNMRLDSNGAVRKALRKTPNALRLRLTYRSGKSSKSETSTGTHPPSRTTDGSDEPYVPSPTTLLRLLNHAENHALDETQDALEDVRQSMLKHTGDAANLAAARHRLGRLYCAFLRRLVNTPVDKVQGKLETPLLMRLETILDDEGISEATIRAIRRAVRLICTDRQALIHMRTRWAIIVARHTRIAPPSVAPPRSSKSSKASKSSKGSKSSKVSKASKEKSIDRPIKHYINHIQRLVQVGGKDVKDSYRRVITYANRHDSLAKAKPGLTKDVCASIEKIVYHVVRCHKKEGRFSIQGHAIRALAASIGRKLKRAGFDKRFVARASTATEAIMHDPASVELAYGWAKKRYEREASADGVDSGRVRRIAAEDDDELFGGRRNVDDSDSTTTSSTGTTSTSSTSSYSSDEDDRGSRRSRSASRRSRSASKKSGGGKSSRSNSRVSRGSRSASGSCAGSKGRARSRSASKGAEDAASRRGRSRSRGSSRRSGRSESRASLRSLEEDADELLQTRVDEEEGIEGEEDSISEDGLKLYDDIGAGEDSEISDDTSQSQWARVEMEKEKARLRRMHLRDIELHGDRDGMSQVDVARRVRSANEGFVPGITNLSEVSSSVESDEPVRRVETMRFDRSPRRRRKSKSPFRKIPLRLREIGSREGVVR